MKKSYFIQKERNGYSVMLLYGKKLRVYAICCTEQEAKDHIAWRHERGI
jgi:hypothetical protein